MLSIMTCIVQPRDGFWHLPFLATMYRSEISKFVSADCDAHGDEMADPGESADKPAKFCVMRELEAMQVKDANLIEAG